ncbi:MAG TPA: hypothetical protein VMT66_14845 [Steroidobacteraceae bacterium]|nr:hypothetical protein [Steroidobacteraceae bacterium]
MTTVAYPPDRPLSVGEVLDVAFRIYRATVVRCLLLATCAVIGGQLPSVYALVKGRGQPVAASGMAAMLTLAQDRVWVALYIVGVLLMLTFYGAMLLREQTLSTAGRAGGELEAAARRAPAIIGLCILLGLGGAACVMPGFLAEGMLRALLLLIALLVLSYAFVAISCAVTILFVEGAGPATSVARSWRLTAGSFWRLSMIYTVALIILLALELVIAAVGGFVVAVLAHGDVASISIFAQVIAILLEALVLPFYGALALAVLADLKVRKEGADLAQRLSATA